MEKSSFLCQSEQKLSTKSMQLYRLLEANVRTSYMMRYFETTLVKVHNKQKYVVLTFAIHKIEVYWFTLVLI